MRALALLALLGGCLESSEPAPYVGTTCSTREYWDTYLNKDLDVLFVIDDSPAMSTYQQALASNAPVFMDILQSLPIPINLRIAVARASDGSFVDPVPCGAQAGARFIEDYHRDTIRNFTGTLQDVFGCLAGVGASSGIQQALAFTSQALSTNRDFLRDSAYLLVVIISAQDDGSSADPLAYADALNALKGTPTHIFPSVITRIPSTRLESFADLYGALGNIISIDLASWANAFRVVASVRGVEFRRSCLDEVLTQPPSCTFTRVQYLGTPMQREIGTMPICMPQGQATGICATLVSDALCSISGTNVVLCYDGYDPNDPTRCLCSGSDVEGETVVVECATKCD